MKAEEHPVAAERTRGLPVRLVRSVDNPLSYLAAADLVIAMAGYNTPAEILALGARALLVPRSGPSADRSSARTAASFCAIVVGASLGLRRPSSVA